MTIGGRSAALADDAKSAPLNAAAATEARPKVFIAINVKDLDQGNWR
jgi:hypothetical protein